MEIRLITRGISLARQEWRRAQFSPIWLLGCVCGAFLALSESGSSTVLGYPTLNQALYGFQLGVSVVFGFVAFLLASGSLAQDLEGSRRDLVFCRPVSRAEFIVAKFTGVFSLSLAGVLPVLVFSAAAPLLHGTFKVHHPGPFLSVLAFCTVPMLAYVTALALALTSAFRRVIVVLPIFVLYFFTAALINPGNAAGVSYLDFSQRLYPRELVVHVPLTLREYTFAGILSPISVDVLLRSGMYLLFSAVLLGCAALALRTDLDTRLTRSIARWFHSLRRAKTDPRAGCPNEPRLGQALSEAPAPDPGSRAAAIEWLRNELTLLGYSARMLLGRNLLATAMILAGLFFVITTYHVGVMQTKTGVLLLQLELFAPLLGIVMFSDLVASEFEAHRADLLRASRHGASWVIWRKLLHAALFSALSCLLLLAALRIVYSEFNVLHALGVVLPGVCFFGMVGLVAASAARRALVGYAAGTVAMVLSMVLKQVEPLTATSFDAREHLANGRLLDDWNWLLAKIVFCFLAAALVAVVLRLISRPELGRRLLISSFSLLLATYLGLHMAWSGGQRGPDADARTTELELREDDTGRLSRRAIVTTGRRSNRRVRSAELVDVRLVKKGEDWEIQSQTPVDLTRELEIPHLELEVSVNPAQARLEGRAQFGVNTVGDGSTAAIRFYLGSELQVQQLTVDGEPANFARYADLISVTPPRRAEPGQQLKVDLQYDGKLELPQNLGFEGVAKDFLFVTSRWYPCLRGTRPGVRPLFTCVARIHTPPEYRVAAGQLLSGNERENVFLWESGGRVEWVPLCVGTFQVYEKPYRDGIGLSFCTFTAKKDFAERTLDNAVQLLRRYETEFGPYQNRHAAIVENRFQNAGGTAFPSMVAIKPERLAPEHEERFATGYLPHELAHLWFGNTVTPWIAESCAVYANYRFLAAEKGKAAAIKFLDTEFYPAIAAPETTAAPLVNAEGALKYTKGGYLLKTLHDSAGQEAVLAVLRSLYRDCAQMRRVDFDTMSHDFVGQLKSAAGPGLENFIEDMTRTVKRFDPAITRIQAGEGNSGSESRIELQHFGEMRLAVPVQVRFTDGSSQALVWAGQEQKGNLIVRSAASIDFAEIDPEHDLLDWNRANNRAIPGQNIDDREPGLNLSGWKTFTAADGLIDADVRAVAVTGHGVFVASWSIQAAMNGRWAIGVVQGDAWEPYAPKAEPVHLVSTMAPTADGSLWLGNHNHLRRMHGNQRMDWFLADIRRGGPIGSGAFSPNPHAKDGPPGSQIYSLLADCAGHVWAGTDRGLAVFSGADCERKTQQGLRDREVFALAEGESGAIWAGTDQGLFRINEDNAVRSGDGPNDLVLSVATGHAGELWCGTFRSGLWQLTADSARQFSHANAPIPDTIFSCIASDGPGRVWAGSPDGLVRFDGKGWTVYTRTNSGLPSNRIHCLTVDSAGRVWLGTDAGLTRFTPERASE